MRVGKEFRFEAAHRLPRHDGKCRRPHGHSYVLWVEVEGEAKMYDVRPGSCPRCGIGQDTDGDGNCAMCERESDENVARMKQTYPSQGMVMDFAHLKAIVNSSVVDLVDHQDLNEVVVKVWSCKADPGVYNVTTAEVLAWLFAQAIARHLPEGVGLERVRLYETATSYAEWDSVYCTGAEYEAFFDVAQFARKE